MYYTDYAMAENTIRCPQWSRAARFPKIPAPLYRFRYIFQRYDYLNLSNQIRILRRLPTELELVIQPQIFKYSKIPLSIVNLFKPYPMRLIKALLVGWQWQVLLIPGRSFNIQEGVHQISQYEQTSEEREFWQGGDFSEDETW